MNAQEVIEAEERYILRTYLRPAPVLERGEGMHLFDTEGQRYLDFAAGIAVAALGHSDPQWAAVVAKQAARLTHVSNLYYTAPQVELARRLVEASFADKVFFCNTGTEANEGAIKFARKFAASQGRPGRALVAFQGAFHGRTCGALSMTHKVAYREPFEPLLPEVRFAPFNDLEAAARVIDDGVCAVFVEPVQGEGGVRPATAEFLQGLRRLCDAHGALLVFDEVQCGLGRTGQLWAYQGYGVEPDLLTLAKPLAGGLPIGAILLRQAVAAEIGPGDHGSTFAAGPVVCAAACHVFDRVSEPDFLGRVAAAGERLRQGLTTALGEGATVRGRGLLVGVEVDRPVAPWIEAARQRGLLVISAGPNILRLCPPLIATDEDIDTAVEILATSWREVP